MKTIPAVVVYLVLEGTYDELGVCGVYATKQKAVERRRVVRAARDRELQYVHGDEWRQYRRMWHQMIRKMVVNQDVPTFGEGLTDADIAQARQWLADRTLIDYVPES